MHLADERGGGGGTTTVENIKNDENETNGVHTMLWLALVGRTKEHCVRGGRGNGKKCTRATEKSNDYNGHRSRENGIRSKIRVVVIIRVVNTRDDAIETPITTRAKLDIFIRLLMVILHTIIAKLRRWVMIGWIPVSFSKMVGVWFF